MHMRARKIAKKACHNAGVPGYLPLSANGVELLPVARMTGGQGSEEAYGEGVMHSSVKSIDQHQPACREDLRCQFGVTRIVSMA
jgi:hypothetical protein